MIEIEGHERRIPMKWFVFFIALTQNGPVTFIGDTPHDDLDACLEVVQELEFDMAMEGVRLIKGPHCFVEITGIAA
jgi:hypothetical protein